jgi:ketosteroid isomerase-like protein
VLLLAACLPGLTPPAHAIALPLLHREDKLHREIENLESEWRTAAIHNDVATASRLLADDYLGINPNGTLETKADALAARRSGTLKISSIEPDNVKVHVYGDTAVVTSQVEVQGRDGERDISGRYHYTRVYSHKSGEWKIVSFEASKLPAGRKH